MILNSMLSGSPAFLFAMSLLLLAIYGLACVARACLRLGQRAFSRARHTSAHF
jgi:hypothetical protein